MGWAVRSFPWRRLYVRARTLNENVVHAVVYDILTDRIVLFHHARDLELGSDTIGGSDQKGILQTLRKTAKATKRADSSCDIYSFGSTHHLLDGLKCTHFVVDIHASCGVGGRLCAHG